ncbi:hypothetical protein [Knoellia sp. LjRoot47]|uniref:hypothetical protein n=1 Tax=Knoellia sp. LjRoot47 TaxID=3342330 RepID=UPI003ECEB3A1
MTRPRVTAHHEIEAFTDERQCTDGGHTTPSVEVRVDFDLHDHITALAQLDTAVAKVKAQIEEAKP